MPEASCIICLKELYLLPESYCVVCPKWKVLQYHASTSSNSLHNLTYFGTCNRETKLPINYVWQIDFYKLTHLKVINQWYVLLGDLFYNMLECKTHKNLNDFSRYIIKYNTIFFIFNSSICLLNKELWWDLRRLWWGWSWSGGGGSCRGAGKFQY